MPELRLPRDASVAAGAIDATPDIPYYGLVLTMPADLWLIFKENRHLLHDLPTLGAEVVLQWMRDKHGVATGVEG